MTTYTKKRIAAGVLLVYVILAGANYYLKLGFLPMYAGATMMFGVIMVLIYSTVFAPTRQEFDEHQKHKSHVGQ